MMNIRVLQEQRQGALLDLGRLSELHVVETLEQILVTVNCNVDRTKE